MLKKLWHWLRCEDENGNQTDKSWLSFRYSEMIKHNPIHGNIGDEDIVKMSHKLENGEYETCYVTIKQLKDTLAAVDHR